jgi:tRNA-splicing ligase RtcB (3'-phosphate/5'-hydroxy nucleic acid ligase)
MEVLTKDGLRIPIKSWVPFAELEADALDQAKSLAGLPFAFKWVALMPDSHVGYGMPIGGVLATSGEVIPNAVGVDIGCGMRALKTPLFEISEEKLKLIMGGIRNRVPLGFNHHKDKQEWINFHPEFLLDQPQIIKDEIQSARYQLGTLGGGNHFIEIQRDADTGAVWVMVHSGSRNFGFKTAKHFNDRARELNAAWYSAIPSPDLSFLPPGNPVAGEYMTAMNFCLEFAKENRRRMLLRVLDAIAEVVDAADMKEAALNAAFDPNPGIDVHHNYAAMENHFGRNVLVHRKGAIRVREGDVGIIPGSMGSASYIVRGLGNPDSFMSASHGAGRRMGREAAKKNLILADEKAKMGGIVSGLRNQSDLEEAPGAYKDIEDVMKNQVDLVSITTKLLPLANIKG